MVYRASLERMCTFIGTGGSNPPLSANPFFDFVIICGNFIYMKNFISSVNSLLEMLSSVEHDINIAGYSLTEKKVYFTIIQTTARTGNCNITDVINTSSLSRSTIYKAIKKLESNNLLNVHQSSVDKRESFLDVVVS